MSIYRRDNCDLQVATTPQYGQEDQRENVAYQRALEAGLAYAALNNPRGNLARQHQVAVRPIPAPSMQEQAQDVNDELAKRFLHLLQIEGITPDINSGSSNHLELAG